MHSGDEPLRWIRVGEGGSSFATIPADRVPRLAVTPEGWRGRVVTDDSSGRVAFLWEPIGGQAGLAPGAQEEFGILTKTNPILREGQLPLDLRSMPFSAGSASGRCWFGRTDSEWLPSKNGLASGFGGATVRPITDGGVTYVVVDAPTFESRLHLGRERPVSLIVPFALSWGTAGGFSSEISFGIGLSWAPSPYVSVFALSRVGTFFFTNGTRTRIAGVDIAIPIRRMTFAEGVSRQSRFIVVGVEYFDRDATRWGGFMKGPQWYVSGQGVAFRVGIRDLAWSW
jgi:hypothetical protein